MIGPGFDRTLALFFGVTWAGIAGWLLQSTVVAGIGLAALKALPRASAAARHLVALATLASLLALPLASWAPKPWASWSLTASFLPPAPRERTSLEAPIEPAAEVAPDLAGPSTPAPSRDETRWAAEPLAPRSRAASTPHWPGILAALAFGVTLLLLARLGLGVLAARSLVRSAAPIDDPILLRELDRARVRLGIGRGVALASSERLQVPIVSGLLWPTLVLPVGAAAWSAERMRAVLLHELAHVRRHDAPALAFTRTAVALLWFHPLVWALARVARRECERACDDVVLGTGLRPSEYATHLLDIARAAVSRPAPGWTLAFARPSSLEGRLVTLLRSDLRRGPASARARLVVAVAALLVLLPLSAIRIVGASGRDAAPSAAGASERHETKPDVAAKEEKHWMGAIDGSKEEVAPSQDPGRSYQWGTVDPARLETARLEQEIETSKSPERVYARAKELYTPSASATPGSRTRPPLAADIGPRPRGTTPPAPGRSAGSGCAPWARSSGRSTRAGTTPRTSTATTTSITSATTAASGSWSRTSVTAIRASASVASR